MEFNLTSFTVLRETQPSTTPVDEVGSYSSDLNPSIEMTTSSIHQDMTTQEFTMSSDSSEGILNETNGTEPMTEDSMSTVSTASATVSDSPNTDTNSQSTVGDSMSHTASDSLNTSPESKNTFDASMSPEIRTMTSSSENDTSYSGSDGATITTKALVSKNALH